MNSLEINNGCLFLKQGKAKPFLREKDKREYKPIIDQQKCIKFNRDGVYDYLEWWNKHLYGKYILLGNKVYPSC